jgi:hypothetical protein
MRGRCLMMVSCAALAGALAGCSGLGMLDRPRVVSPPPMDLALAKNVIQVAKAVKWNGLPEASPVRHAHLLAPADWIVCAQSGARDLSPPYALFFNGDKMVHYRMAVELDDCRRMPYALVPEPPSEEKKEKR